MTDKEQIICKYKFRNKEKFDGKPYCTCFCELCEDLPICVHNCQIFEDYKQLTRKTQECEQLQEKYEALKLENQEGYEIVAELKQECESLKQETEILQNNYDTATRDCNELIEELKQECEKLKKELNGSEKWRIKAESLNEKLSIEKYRYRKALEEIESICLEDVHTFADGTQIRYDSLDDILNIINKAKGKE